jgi:hypothetical protein
MKNHDRGEYRSIYVALPDSAEFMALSGVARAMLYQMKMRLGRCGIAVLYPRATMPEWAGFPAEQCDAAWTELLSGADPWLITEGNVWWMRNGLAFEPSKPLLNQNQRIGIADYLRTLPRLEIVTKFVRYYELQDVYPLDEEAPSKGLGRASEAPTEAGKREDGRGKTEEGRRSGSVVAREAAPDVDRSEGVPTSSDQSAVPTAEEYIRACIVAANRAGNANQNIPHYQTIPAGHGASYQAAHDWWKDEVPLEVALEVIADVGGAYVPRRDDKQISSLSYFDTAVRRAATARREEAVAAANVGAALGDREAGTAVIVRMGDGVVLRGARGVHAVVTGALERVAGKAQRKFSERDALTNAAELLIRYWMAKTGREDALIDEARIEACVKALRANGGDLGELLYVIDGAVLSERHREPRWLEPAFLFRNRGEIEDLRQKPVGWRKGKVHPFLEDLAAGVHEQPGEVA